MLTRNPAGYAALFLLSAPAWWLFELLNLRTQNWFYDGRQFFSNLEYFLLASLSFSTVMPAVFGSAELLSTCAWIDRFQSGPVIAPTRRMLLGAFLTGAVMLVLLLLWPCYFFAFLWGSVFLLLEPVNACRGNGSLLNFTARGDWRPAIALSAGCLLCAVFWEMWNYFSYPKWIYEVPFVDFLHIFEMPLLGYLGYIPFAWELHALHCLAMGLAGRAERRDLVCFGTVDSLLNQLEPSVLEPEAASVDQR